MRSTTTTCAREIAEAMLDAVEIVEATHEPIGVYFDEHLGVAYATRKYTIEETVVTVYPADKVPKEPPLKLVGE